MTELVTERLRLRPWRDDDLVHLERLNSDPRFTRFLNPGGAVYAPGWTADKLARMRADWDSRGWGAWAVEERGTARFVGRVGFQYHRMWPDDPELGWGVDPELWGRGYATEAAAGALRHAFEALAFPRVVSILHPENTPSIRVAEKLGERPYATVRWEAGGIDLLVYAIEREESSRLQSSA
ncbi:MAG: GNAT family N-acetyltransferase [Actinomycetota bacterium]|nr:GNAT family N-acetyltransferase [Actinomycetota bacterium]